MPAKFKVGDIVRPIGHKYHGFPSRHTGEVVKVEHFPLCGSEYVFVRNTTRLKWWELFWLPPRMATYLFNDYEVERA